MGRIVLVTGGTGFLGSHTVSALKDQGDDVRLLVRSKDRVAPALEPHGVTDVEIVEGDITDEQSVDEAMEGCEVVVHAASVYSLDKGDADIMARTNLRGTNNVLKTTEKFDIPAVYVSSFAALLPPKREVITPDHPTGSSPDPYVQSKAESEDVARMYQQLRRPVTIVQPGSIWGPDDPYFGESAQLAAAILKSKVRLIPDGGLPIVDVRDVADVLARAARPETEPGNYLVGGTYLPLAELIERLAKLTGRTIPMRIIPDRAAHFSGRLGNFLPRRLARGLNLPPLGLVWLPIQRARTDDSRARDELGFAPRPIGETLRDTVRSLLAAGRITEEEAGELISARH